MAFSITQTALKSRTTTLIFAITENYLYNNLLNTFLSTCVQGQAFLGRVLCNNS